MSSLLTKYAEKERQLEALKAELEKLEQDERLKKEVAFKEQLEALMQEFDKTAKDVLELLQPSSASTQASSSTATRRKRKLKIYQNPHTGEEVQTRSGNQKVLKAWKEEYGADTVESWLVRTEA
ncbi:histone-like nucleoid-structuring protein, MvaT/MvaU family [Chromohalobacter japonicus]|uniref:histone-like nucleoid-structuring protein, MvaT/MvaU family n=1 Tax=Chromohalobacter japonicus TaxID=223900 RepID=UPI001FF57F8C|nr:histone-like nucleoid-structuring protein, MvaT/MvaU family [Chromohalobacter japonicus]MCK0753556.1 DNA binding protein [Chromohalobacter japonicus]